MGSLAPETILAAMEVRDVTSIAPVTGGQDTAIWRVDTGKGAYALRVFRADQENTCRRELLALEAAAAGGIPVPTVQGHVTWHARPVLLLSWCPGVSMLHEIYAHPYRILRLGAALGSMQARIHSVPAPAAMRKDMDFWIRFIGPDEIELQEHLRVVAGGADRLIHLDYHPLNVLTDGHVVTAVLDWANTLPGDPRADLARTLTILVLDPGVTRARARVFRRLLAYAWWRGYRRAAGPQPDMPLFYAWAGAAMVQDLTPKLGQRAGLEPHHLDPVRRWTEEWKRRAGVKSPVVTP